jgi:hypothetical protein
MKRFRTIAGAVMVIIIFAALFVLMPNHSILNDVVLAQTGPSGSFVLFPSGSDPCENPSIAKSQVAVNISGAAATTELVAAVAGKTVYACDLLVSDVGTSPTIQFKTGTKVTTPCDTGGVNLSGTIVVATGTIFTVHTTNAFAQGAANGEFCLVAGGTTPSIQGMFTYVQQ